MILDRNLTLFKHEAIEGYPFNLEILLQNMLFDFPLVKVEVRDVADNVIATYNAPFNYDPIKNMYYVENVVINQAGLYYAHFYFDRDVNNYIVMKEQFKVTSLNLVNGYSSRMYVKHVKQLGHSENSSDFGILVYLYSDEPVIVMKNVNIVHHDVSKKLNVKWFHQVAPQVFKIVVENINPTEQTFAISHLGIINVEMELIGVLRDEPYRLSSSLFIV